MSAQPAPTSTAEIEAFLARDASAASLDARVALARDVLSWAHERYAGRLTVASSMGDEVLLHLAGTTVPGIDVFFLDTGYHFAETLGTRDAYSVMLPLAIRTVVPKLSVAQQDAEFGPQLHDRDPDRCCAMRKVAPLNQALEGYAAWVSGVRRADAATRLDTKIVDWDAKRRMLKINPIAGWTHEDLEAYADEHGVFMNPLREIGFASIGCAPCTRPVAEGEDPRSGRWSGRSKIECGLHQ